MPGSLGQEAGGRGWQGRRARVRMKGKDTEEGKAFLGEAGDLTGQEPRQQEQSREKSGRLLLRRRGCGGGHEKNEQTIQETQRLRSKHGGCAPVAWSPSPESAPLTTALGGPQNAAMTLSAPDNKKEAISPTKAS